jgi:hypothetical protein
VSQKTTSADRNGYHMVACATEVDDITTGWYKKNDFWQTVIKI